MATLNISLPQSLKEFARNQHDYSTPSDYVRSLIRQDKEQQAAQKQLDDLLLEGLKSGDPIPVTPEYWKEKKARLMKKINNQ